jgi:hypothetical protein
MAEKKLDFKDFLTVDYATGMDPIIKKNAKKRKMTAVPEAVEVDEALNQSQRRKKSMQMKRLKSKIAIGRKRQAARFADMPRLKKRAMKAARRFVLKKLTKGIDKSELSFAKRAELEKRLESPAFKARLAKFAVRLLPKVRKQEMARHQSQGNDDNK